MNKELIKKYKVEFDHWLNGGKLLQKQINLAIPAEWEEFLEDWDWPIDELIVIINDEYVEFRKALAEGKTIQVYGVVYQHLTDPKLDIYDWKDFKSFTKSSTFTYSPECYRIKPEEPQFKVGDWAVNKTSKQRIIKKVTSVYSDSVTVGDATVGINVMLIKDLELWKPQLGEWCWFYRGRPYDTPCLRKFITVIDDTYIALNSQNSSHITPTEVPSFKKGISDSYVIYENCEPFIGRLPSYLKE